MKSLLLILVQLAVFLPAMGQLPNYVPTAGLEGFYSFSGNVLDNSGNGNNSSNYSIISTTDRFSNPMSALNFTGSATEYLNYGDVAAYAPYIGSFSFWINPVAYGGSTASTWKPILSKWMEPSDMINSSYIIYLDGSDLCLLLTDGFTNDTLRSPLATIPLNAWSHVVITANYGFINFYVNGALVTATSSPISSFSFTNSDFKVGGWYQDINTSYSAFSGKIDDVGIWSRELEACEVTALYEGVPCTTSGLPSLVNPDKSLVGVFDLLGRETTVQPGVPLIYVYSDGTRERKFRWAP